MAFKKFQNSNEIRRLINRQNLIQKRAVAMINRGTDKGNLYQKLNQRVGIKRQMSQATINVMMDIFRNERITSIPDNSFVVFARTTLNVHDGEPQELLLQLNKLDSYTLFLAPKQSSEKIFNTPKRGWLMTLRDDGWILMLPGQNPNQGIQLVLPEASENEATTTTSNNSSSTNSAANSKAPTASHAPHSNNKSAASAAAQSTGNTAPVSHAKRSPKVSSKASPKVKKPAANSAGNHVSSNQATVKSTVTATSHAADSAAPSQVSMPAYSATNHMVSSAAATKPLPGPREADDLIKALVESGHRYRVVGLDYGKINMITATDGMDNSLQIPGSIISKHILDYQHEIRQLQRQTQTLDDDVELTRLSYMLKRYVLKSCRKIVNQLIAHYGSDVIYVTELHPSLDVNKTPNIILSPDYFYKALFTILFELVGQNSAIIQVPNNETSIICPVCGFTSAGNRQKEVHTFKCLNCGFESNDDQAAATNIRQRGLRYISNLTKNMNFAVPTPEVTNVVAPEEV
ncbi:zinc ribbon domain-containing protein [Loigolactobacillus binensis]|uniref:Zinc ribbon domain-containing protein n=1 Tax=Loigolactobacillus binensis TaxID=2559922 RepID=A0ABW3EG85_9LACO|nr:zinc ribbon domain-containing protein [Loigolactobacillus binensis]